MHWSGSARRSGRPGRTDELDGRVLSLVFDARNARSHLAVLDAARPAAGPVARAWFDHNAPPTLHGAWVSATREAPV